MPKQHQLYQQTLQAKLMLQTWTSCLPAEETLHKIIVAMIAYSQRCKRENTVLAPWKQLCSPCCYDEKIVTNTSSSALPVPRKAFNTVTTSYPRPVCISVCWTLNYCVFSVSSSTQRVHVWVMAIGWTDTQWQTRPWADRTNAITPHLAHSAAAQNTAISYLSRQLCLRRCIQKMELAFHHTNASLRTERNDKRRTDLTRIWLRQRHLGKLDIVFSNNARPREDLYVLY